MSLDAAVAPVCVFQNLMVLFCPFKEEEMALRSVLGGKGAFDALLSGSGLVKCCETA